MVRCFRSRISSAEPLRRDRSQLLGQQVELQGEDVGGLGALAHATPPAHELVPEGALDPGELLGVAGRVLSLAEYECRPLQQVGEWAKNAVAIRSFPVVAPG